MPVVKEPKYREGEHTRIAVMANDIQYVKKAVDDLILKVDHSYVTKEEFTPVKNLVYGLVSLILIAVFGALIALVVKG